MIDQNTIISQELSKIATKQAILDDFYFACRYLFMINQLNDNKNPNDVLKWVPNWHHKCICEYMTSVFNGEITNLIINIPPSHSKTLIVIVLFTVWAFLNNPRSRFIHASYSIDKSLENSGLVKTLFKVKFEPIKLDDDTWLFDLGTLFPKCMMDKRSGANNDWSNSSNGRFYATSAGGAITGFHAGLTDEYKKSTKEYKFSGAVLIDDPHKLQDISSKVRRETVHNWYFDVVAESRLATRKTPKVIIMQRAHPDDLCGRILNKQKNEESSEYTVLLIPGLISGDALLTSCLPYLTQQEVELIKPKRQYALWDIKKSKDQYLSMKRDNPSLFNTQYQQNPGILEGNMFNISGFKRHNNSDIPINEKKLGYFTVDSAMKSNEDNDFTVIQYWVKCRSTLYLVDQLRFKKEQPNILILLVEFMEKYKPQVAYVEDKASGTGIIQYLESMNLPVEAFEPCKFGGSKVNRAEIACQKANYCNISIPVEAVWINEFLEELTFFPKVTHDDQVDAFVMGILLGNVDIELHPVFSRESHTIDEIPVYSVTENLSSKILLSFCFEKGKSCIVAESNGFNKFLHIKEIIIENDTNVSNHDFIERVKAELFPVYTKEIHNKLIVFSTTSMHKTINMGICDYSLRNNAEHSIQDVFKHPPIMYKYESYNGEQLYATAKKVNEVLKKSDYNKNTNKLQAFLTIHNSCEMLINCLLGTIHLSHGTNLDQHNSWKFNEMYMYNSIIAAFYTIIIHLDVCSKDNSRINVRIR